MVNGRLDVDAPAAGARIGPYRLLEPLGEGGAALVYRAAHEESGQIVALKTVRAASEGMLASVRREIRALGRLRHPGVVSIFEGGIFEGRPWYTMEHLVGRTLRDHLRSLWPSQALEATLETESPAGTDLGDSAIIAPDAERPARSFPSSTSAPWRSLPKSAAFSGQVAWYLGVIRALCQPLAYIHGEGLVHRDLKPSNVFVRTDGRPVLMDFGLVWLVQEASGREVLSIDAARGGTIAYMAPEQARGERMDARGDLFALGCILYEAITGQPPYPARTRRELIDAHERPPVPPSQLASGVPPELDALALGLLERNPRDRIGHASDVAAVLADLDAQTPGPEVAPPAKAYLYRPELAGRGALLEAALGPLSGLKQSRGGLALVAGESGIGKTSFVAEVARRAGSNGIRVITSECVAVGVAAGRGVRQGGPLYPLARLLQAVGDRCLAEGAALTNRLLGERAKVLAATEPSLRGLPGVAALPEPPDVPGEAARRRLIDAMAETLSAFAHDRPTLVVIDDLQWADDLTLAFLSSLSDEYFRNNPIFVLGTYRSEESTPEIERIAAAASVATLQLDRLDAATIGTMAADMLGQRRVSDRLASFLSSASAGNPFFVAEYLRAAVDAGLMFRDERGHWQQADGAVALDTLGLPRNLRDLVTRRLESLTEAARRLVEIAAVLGREIETDVLGDIAIDCAVVSNETAFDDVLGNLFVHQVLESAPGGSVRFVHDKLREIAYEGLSPDRLRLLHGTAARLLERWHSDRGTIARGAASLAHHFEKAGDLAKAVMYFDQAGEAAHEMHANQESFRLLDRARSLQASLPDATSTVTKARRERLLGLNALALGNVNEALARLTDAAGTAGRPWPASRVALVVRSVVALFGEIVRRSLRVAPSAPAAGGDARELLLEAARAYERLLVVNYFATGDMLAVVLSAVSNMGLAERAGGASAERALGYATFAAMCALLPFEGIARSYCARALAVARESGDQIAESWVRMNVALVHLQAGRWDEMTQQLQHVRGVARQIGFSRRWEEATSQFSTGRLLKGDLAEAAALNDELSGAIERADPQSKCWAIVREAELHLLRGDAAAALRAARQGERFCDQGLGFAEWIYTLGPLALAHLRSGDARAARAAADRCAEWLGKGSAPVFYNIFAYGAVAEVYLALWADATNPGSRRQLAEKVRQAVKRLRLTGRAMAIAAPRAFLWRGIIAATLDARPLRARRLFNESLSRARRFGMTYDEAMALAAIGEHSADRAEADRHLAEAASLFRQIGAVRDLARVEALAARAAASATGPGSPEAAAG
jgi:serine/threonine protein kinase